jgi:hypothetical protein
MAAVETIMEIMAVVPTIMAAALTIMAAIRPRRLQTRLQTPLQTRRRTLTRQAMVVTTAAPQERIKPSKKQTEKTQEARAP